jgi:diguanylate cyclase (GGDEF)-like protein/PAS domain S-box-containing protein
MAPNKQGSMLDDDGLHLFRPFHTRLFDTSGGLTLITTIPQKEITQAFDHRHQRTRSDAITQVFVLGIVAGLLALFWEMSEQSKLEQTFSELIIDHAVAVAMTDENHRILRVNSRLCQVLGKESSQLIGQFILDFQPSQAPHHHMMRALKKTGEWSEQWLITSDHSELIFKVEVHSIVGKMGKINHYVYSFSDISEQHRALKNFKEQSERDASTSLWNKEKFNHTLTHYARLQARYSDQPNSCLAIVDIDNFKQINDNFGHNVGDEIILHLTSHMLSVLRDTDFVARIGGDEFAIILQHADTQIAFNMMTRICKAVAEQTTYPVTISIGLADITTSANQTIINADKALYLSKQRGKNCVSSHDPLPIHPASKNT